MAGGGLVNHSFLLSLLGILSKELSIYIGGTTGEVASVAITTISILITLGGVTVAIGGLLILIKHVTTGRTFIALGGGAGFLGLLVSFGYVAFTSGVASAIDHSVYWIGVVLAVIARRVAKGA